jgi:glutamate carboxypeptidase
LACLIVTSCLLSWAVPAAAQRLNPVEEAMARYLDATDGEAIALLERVVNINSGTMNHDGVREVGLIFRNELDVLGFQTRWIDLPPGTNRAGHLFAERLGTGQGPKILMIGHLDTVFEEDSPFQRFERSGNSASGPGVADMKSGDVTILYALKALAQAGVLDDLSVIVALTGEEEAPGLPLSVSRKDLVEAGNWSDLALGFEGGVRAGGVEYATVARRSSTDWTLKVQGQMGHSSRIFSEEYGAGGIRTISNEQLERTRKRMREVVVQSRPRTSATITFTDGYPPMAPTPENFALLEKLSRVSQDLGYGPMEALDPGLRGAADISFVAPYTPGLAGMGPYGDGAHSLQETLDLSSVTVAAKRAAILMYRLTREEEKELP